MLTITALTLVGLTLGQYHPTCVYEDQRSGFMLNLTSVSGYHLEYKGDPNHFYYYTPCTNNEVCYQGNAEFRANAVQYKAGENTCSHYLSVDHHERPDYIFGTAAWHFQYEDGEKCDQTQEPREMNVFYHCDENFQSGVYVEDVYEFETCKYLMEVRTPLACVPENSHNANCQWRYRDGQNNTFYLDLSDEKGNYYRGERSGNGYQQFYSPCLVYIVYN